MNGDVSLSLIGCFFVIKSNIAIFRQLHYLQHKRPWEFSVWTRTTIENNMNHSCKNGSPPPYLTFMQFVPISESLMNTWIIKDRVRVALDGYKIIRFANHAVLKFLLYSYIHLFGIIIINDKSRKPLRIIQWNFANHY